MTNGSFENEPNVELIYAKILSEDEVDGNRNWAKNTRQLQFESNVPPGPVVYGCDANQRMVVHREPLSRHKPAPQAIEASLVGLIANWIAKRYRRAAFPDNFNIRTTRAASKIRDKAKKKGKWISGIYLLVSDDELPFDKIYDVILIATMRVTDYSDEHARKSATELLGVIRPAWRSLTGGDDPICNRRLQELVPAIEPIRFLIDADGIEVEPDPIRLMREVFCESLADQFAVSDEAMRIQLEYLGLFVTEGTPRPVP